jgi:hypothetical protein
VRKASEHAESSHAKNGGSKRECKAERCHTGRQPAQAQAETMMRGVGGRDDSVGANRRDVDRDMDRDTRDASSDHPDALMQYEAMLLAMLLFYCLFFFTRSNLPLDVPLYRSVYVPVGLCMYSYVHTIVY